MATEQITLPPGFVLDEVPQNNGINLPEGFVLDNPKPNNGIVNRVVDAIKKVGEFTLPINPISKIANPNESTNNPILKSLQLQEKVQPLMQERPGAPYGFNLVAGPILRTTRDIGLTQPTTIAGYAGLEGLIGPIAERIATTPQGRSLISKYIPNLGQDLLKQTENLPMEYKSLKELAFPTDVNNVIDKSIDKAIRPSVSGKATASQSESYYSKARMAVKTIYDNKNNLQFIDEGGQPISKLPESLNEFSSAIEQTKNKVFDSYNSIAKQAGEQGGTVDLTPIASEVEKVASNKTLKTLHPEIVNYALQKSEALKSAGSFTTEEAQNAIKMLNNDLKAFYKNPTFDTAAKAEIDAGITNMMRKSLDNQIESLTGKQYQVLKNQYGALKSIEKDVNHRMIVDARKNIKGLIDFTDVLSGGQITRGILTLNPTEFATGLAQKGIARYIKSLNDPNRIVKNMFKVIEKVKGRGF